MNIMFRYATIAPEESLWDFKLAAFVPSGFVRLHTKAGNTTFYDYDAAATFCAHLGYEIVPLNSRIGRELLAKARAK